jgi:hypothetical protein
LELVRARDVNNNPQLKNRTSVRFAAEICEWLKPL